MARRRMRGGVVVVTVALAAGCAGTTSESSTGPSGSNGTGTGGAVDLPPPPQTPTANPPAPVESIVQPGGALLRRHGVCSLVAPPVDCTVPPCPPGTAERVPCPESVVDEGRITRDDFGACVFVAERCPPPVAMTCNPPPPQQVPCDREAVESGLQTRDARGRCTVHVQVSCPEPYQPPCTDGASRPVACPPR